MRRRRMAAVAIAAALLTSILVSVPRAADTAVAATGDGFDAGYIISDENFYNRAALNAGQIQAFLNDKGANCRANSLPCLKDVVLTWDARGADAYCGALPAGAGLRAADLFVAVATACGINPQVLLVLVEKEQSLVTRSSPTDYSYRYATGFACPDTSGCSNATAGFVTQVYLAAKQFQRYRINPGGFNYQAGRNNNILFHPSAACGSTSVFIRNQATAGLYNYTPYQPNAAALANLYGTGDGCSSYGNRNFWRMFNDWFGASAAFLTAGSFEGSVAGWGFANGALDRQLVGPVSDAKSGQHYVALYAHTPERSLSQDVRTAISPRQSYTASIWVRSATSGREFTGTLALWALGGSTEVRTSRFTVGNDWTEVTVTLPIARTGHSTIRLEVYLTSTDAILNLDSTSLERDVSQVPRDPVTLSAPSFENSVGSWTFKNGFMNRQIYNFGAEAQDGSWILASNTAAAGRSVGQDVARNSVIGDSYTATVWLRSSSGTVPFDGIFALWALGGSSVEASSTSFSVGPQWTPVTTTLTIKKGAAQTLRLEVYLNSANFDLWLDNASIVPNLAANPSFEGSVAGWNTGIVNSALESRASSPELPAVDGKSFAATVPGFVSGSVATDILRKTEVGETYTASIWVRSATPGDPWEGTLALWALGGSNEVATVPVVAGDTWSEVQVGVTVGQPGHDRLRFELYTNSGGEVLLLDGARVR